MPKPVEQKSKPKSAPKPPVVRPVTRVKPTMPAGYFQTGENERKTVMVGGKPVRMGPTSMITPPAPKPGLLQSILRALMGTSQDKDKNPSNVAGVRG